MNNINIKIMRYTDYTHSVEPGKIVGFNVERADDASLSAYHEIILTSSVSGSQFIGRTTEEVIDLAFSLLSGSISRSATKLAKHESVIGSYYIPN